MTSDERREVAERLHEYVETNNILTWGEVLSIIMGHRVEDPMDRIVLRIADLIDPTCERVAMDSAGRAPYYTGGLALNDVRGGCSECGYPFGRNSYRIGNLFDAPSYCPNCGARVVSDLEDITFEECDSGTGRRY